MKEKTIIKSIIRRRNAKGEGAMKERNPKFKIGDAVWKINNDLSIVQKKIAGYKKNEKDEINYELDVKFCNGISEKELFKTKSKAEVKKKNFLDDLKFKVGDLVVFEYTEYSSYSSKKKTIGKITQIEYSGNPYKVMGSYKEFNNVSDENVLLKIKNEFIENYEDLQELYEQFTEKEKEINLILSLIHEKHDELEKELETSIRKGYSIFNWNKSKPKFEDRFSYVREHDYD